MQDHRAGKKHRNKRAAAAAAPYDPPSLWGDYFEYKHRGGFRIVLKRKELQASHQRQLTNSQWSILVDLLREWYDSEAPDLGQGDQAEAQRAYIEEGVRRALQLLLEDTTGEVARVSRGTPT
jgi:hypothetical protein